MDPDSRREKCNPVISERELQKVNNNLKHIINLKT